MEVRDARTTRTRSLARCRSLAPPRHAGGIGVHPAFDNAARAHVRGQPGLGLLEPRRASLERLLVAARARLANAEFIARAPAAVVEGAVAREVELVGQVDRLRDRLGR